MNERKIGTCFAVILIGLMFSGCDRTDDLKIVSLGKKEQTDTAAVPQKAALRAAIGAMITHKSGIAYYRQILEHLGNKLGVSVKIVDRENYDEINQLLEKKEVDMAFVCSGPYAEGHDKFGLELLAVPQVNGGTSYYSYIIVHKDSPISSFNDLKGRSFAFVDPKSNTGKLVPCYVLATKKTIPEKFFSKYIYTNAHDDSIRQVAQKTVDGAAVDSLIWEYNNKTNPEFTSRTKIIWKSEPFAIPPFVVRPGVDAQMKAKLKEILLNIHTTPEGKAVLDKMMIEKFVEAKDSDYDSIRKMKQLVEKAK